MKSYSVIIPTMWRSDLLLQMLQKYEDCECVKEVIIIDNNPNGAFDIGVFDKVSSYTKGENIFVNPAWNWGVQFANHNLILANDDILIDNLDDVLSAISDSDFDIIGTIINPDHKGKRIDDISHFPRFPANNFGCFMYVKNYVMIPEEIKIWYGDDLQFKMNAKRGRMVNYGIHTRPSTTINSDARYFRNIIGKNDIRIVREMKERGEEIGKLLLP